MSSAIPVCFGFMFALATAFTLGWCQGNEVGMRDGICYGRELVPATVKGKHHCIKAP